MYNPDLLKPYLEAKYTKDIPFTNKELYLLCGCESDNQKASIRSLKSRYIKEFESKNIGETSETKLFQKSKVSTKNEVKDSIQEVSKGHVLELINKYPELPLFIYSKIFERIMKEYPYSRTCEHMGETEPLLIYSFYDMYIELFESINKGDYNKEIKDYMKDVIQSYGDTWCLHRWDKPFTKERLEEKTYMSEEEAQEWIEGVKERGFYDPEYHDKRAKELITEGRSDTDYTEELDCILKVISELMSFMNKIVSPDNYYSVRSQIAHYLMFDYSHYNDFDNRLKEYVKSDIVKYFIDVKRHGNYPLFYNTLEELYEDYDQRWINVNEIESCILSSSIEKINEYIANNKLQIEQEEQIIKPVYDTSDIKGELESEL